MNIIRALHVRHNYRRDQAGEQAMTALDDLSLEIAAGSHVAIVGHNGSGKSTLARHINALLRPSSGTIWIDGMDTKDNAQLLNIRKTAGMVFQNPDNQIIADVVEEDVAFGPENLGMPTEKIWERVAEGLEGAGIAKCRYQSPNRLSGGQKQRVAIAGIMAMRPAVMILDEATAMLDPQGRRMVMETVRRLNQEAGVTVLWITHDMDEAAAADRVIVLNHGKIAMDGSPEAVFSRPDILHEAGLALPPAAQVAERLRADGMKVREGILTVDDLAKTLAEMLPGSAGASCRPAGKAEQDADTPVILELKDVSYIYHPGTSYAVHALDRISLKIHQGSFIGLIGHTGSGKSTMLQLLNGLTRASEGQVFYEGTDIADKGPGIRWLCANVGLVFQNPEYQLFEETVLKDVCFGPLNLGRTQEEALMDAREALTLTGIDERIYEKSPFELSGGQMRRVAIAGILAMHPKVLVLDEPAAGLDPQGRMQVLALAKRLQKERGMTVIWSSHAMEDVAAYADRLIVMHEGRIALDGHPLDVYADETRLTGIGLALPQTIRLTQQLRRLGIDVGEDALTPERAAELILDYRNGHGGGADAV